MKTIRFPVFVIRQHERAIVERFGRYEAAEKYFTGNAKELKHLEVTENALKDNSKVVITDKGITPTLVIGELPVGRSADAAVDVVARQPRPGGKKP